MHLLMDEAHHIQQCTCHSIQCPLTRLKLQLNSNQNHFSYHPWRWQWRRELWALGRAGLPEPTAPRVPQSRKSSETLRLLYASEMSAHPDTPDPADTDRKTHNLGLLKFAPMLMKITAAINTDVTSAAAHRTLESADGPSLLQDLCELLE